jgi:hypothetical protein
MAMQEVSLTLILIGKTLDQLELGMGSLVQ